MQIVQFLLQRGLLVDGCVFRRLFHAASAARHWPPRHPVARTNGTPKSQRLTVRVNRWSDRPNRDCKSSILTACSQSEIVKLERGCGAPRGFAGRFAELKKLRFVPKPRGADVARLWRAPIVSGTGHSSRALISSPAFSVRAAHTMHACGRTKPEPKRREAMLSLARACPTWC